MKNLLELIPQVAKAVAFLRTTDDPEVALDVIKALCELTPSKPFYDIMFIRYLGNLKPATRIKAITLALAQMSESSRNEMIQDGYVKEAEPGVYEPTEKLLKIIQEAVK